MFHKLTVSEFFRRFPDDDACLAHLMEVRSDIVKILEDKYAKAGAAPTFNLMELLMGGYSHQHAAGHNCWFSPMKAALKKTAELGDKN